MSFEDSFWHLSIYVIQPQGIRSQFVVLQIIESDHSHWFARLLARRFKPVWDQPKLPFVGYPVDCMYL